VGEGELAAQTRALAGDLAVPLVLTGYRPDAALVTAAFDVYVVTSRYEGVGRAVTEALASGRPVVATAVDGVVDLVTHGATGLLVAPRDVEGLANATCWLLDHPAEAAAMGRQGSGLVGELFTTERMCAALDEVYQQQLGAVGAGMVGTAGTRPNAVRSAALRGVAEIGADEVGSALGRRVGRRT
jgi:glycosyltransferase involved in cell wall biosynthesis